MSEKPGDGWRTPRDLFKRLDAEFKFRVDVACTPENALVPCGLSVRHGKDGLVEDWSLPCYAGVGGAAFCNPPYSDVRPWLRKAALEAQRGVTTACLVPADTSTRWWRDLVANTAAEVRFFVGRIRFLTPDGKDHSTRRGGGGQTGPSALVVYRPGGGPPHYTYMEARPAPQRRLPGTR